MQAQMVSPDAPLGIADKERRYRAILREGAAAERKYPDAPNLHVARNLMLDAAMGLARIRVDPELLTRVRAIADCILASDAPQPAKAKADAVVAEEALAKTQDDERTDALLLEMVHRYAETSAAVPVLQWAINVAHIRRRGRLTQSLVAKLANDHADEPGVVPFVRRFGRYTPRLRGRLEARLPRLDGKGEIVLPTDFFGRCVLIHFWSAADPRSAIHIEDLKRKLDRHKGDGLVIIGVSLDRSQKVVAKAVADLGANWPHVFSGQGQKDPFVVRCRVTTGPAYLLLTPAGTVASAHYQCGEPLRGWDNPDSSPGRLLASGRRFCFYLSGEYLLAGLLEGDRLPAAAKGLPEGLAKALNAQVFTARTDLSAADKARRCREIVRLGTRIESDHPDLAGLPVIRAVMLIAAKWLAVHGHAAGAPLSPAAEPDAMLALAGRIVRSDASPQTRLFADYLLRQRELRGTGEAEREAAEHVRAFVERNSRADEADLYVTAAMLAQQCCPSAVRRFIETLEGKHFRRMGVPTFVAAISGRDPFRDKPFEAQLTELPTGREIRLPQDTRGKPHAVCFWSTGRPPPPWMCTWRSPRIIGICLDESRQAATTFARDNCPYWTHAFSGKGLADETARRYDVWDLPSLWHVTPDGKVRSHYDLPRGRWDSQSGPVWRAQGAFAGPESHFLAGFLGPEQTWPTYPGDRAPEAWYDARRQELLPYYTTGEFLIETLVGRNGLPAEGKAGLPAAAVKALNAQMIRPHMDVPQAAKTQRCREILRLGAEVETAHPKAPGLAALRNLMMIAARWLAVRTGDKQSGRRAVAIARRLLASDAPLRSRLLADHLAFDEELSTTQAGVRQTADQIRAFHRRNSEPHPAYSRILAVVLATSSWRASEKSRHLLASELCAGNWGRIDKPWARAFTSAFSRQPWLLSWAEEPDPRRFEARVSLLGGGEMQLPRDLLGKSIIIHFWSVDAPGADVGFSAPRGVAVVAVNLDPERRREEVKRYAKKHFPDWIHAFSGKGFDDPTARRYDIHLPPKTVAVAVDGSLCGVSHGRVFSAFTPGMFTLAIRGLNARVRWPRDYLYDRVFLRHPFSATLSPLWGDKPIVLPRDANGKAAVLYFWEVGRGRFPAWGEARRLEEVQRRCLDNGVKLVSIGFGRSRADVQAVWGKPRDNWIEAFSVRGYQDPVVDRYGVWAMPAYWLIGPDGRVCWYTDDREDLWQSETIYSSPARCRFVVRDHPVDRLKQAMAEKGFLKRPAAGDEPPREATSPGG